MRAEHSTRPSLWFWWSAGLFAMGLAAWGWLGESAGTNATSIGRPAAEALRVGAAEPRASDVADKDNTTARKTADTSALEAHPLAPASPNSISVAAVEPRAASEASEPAAPAEPRAPAKPTARGPALESVRSQIIMPRPRAGLVDSRVSNGPSRARAGSDLCKVLAEQQRQATLSEEEQALWRRYCASR